MLRDRRPTWPALGAPPPLRGTREEACLLEIFSAACDPERSEGAENLFCRRIHGPRCSEERAARSVRSGRPKARPRSPRSRASPAPQNARPAACVNAEGLARSARGRARDRRRGGLCFAPASRASPSPTAGDRVLRAQPALSISCRTLVVVVVLDVITVSSRSIVATALIVAELLGQKQALRGRVNSAALASNPRHASAVLLLSLAVRQRLRHSRPPRSSRTAVHRAPSCGWSGDPIVVERDRELQLELDGLPRVCDPPESSTQVALV